MLAFYILIIISGIALWALLSGLYGIFGKIISKIVKKIKININDNEEEKE